MIHETRSIYYIYKLGDARTFATPTAPSVEWAASLKQQGYTIVLVKFSIPVQVDDVAYGDTEATDPQYTGLLCTVCDEPQFSSPGGRTCKNGHGGAAGFGLRPL